MTRITSNLHDENYTFWSYLSQLFLEWEISKTIYVDKNQNPNFIFNNFFPKTVAFVR